MKPADDLRKAIESQNDETGINVNKLRPGDMVRAFTLNSIYEIILLPHTTEVMVRGDGRYFNDLERVSFIGSTWGGSATKSRWVGVGMHMEFVRLKPGGIHNLVITSPVRKLQIIRCTGEQP